jgi:Tol biopolymer transport system component
MGADGSGRIDLTRDPHADITPSWSADGRRIAFASDRSGLMEIYVMNADGSGVVQVTHDPGYADDPHFTADGRYVVYESKTGADWEIRRIGVDGSGEVDLTRNRASDRSPTTSPNGRLVAFASNRGTTGTHVWVMSINGRAARRVTTRRGNQFDPAWAPVGGRLAYVAGTLATGTSIWTVLANGTNTRRLTALHASDQLNPSWSPDSQSIVYQDCQPANLTTCVLFVTKPGGSPLNISQLRAPYLDTFDSPSDQFGRPFQLGTGSQTVVQNGRLLATIAANATQGGQYDNINAGWYTQCKLVGDFDVQADYQLLAWPPANGVAVTLNAVYPDGPLAIRESQAWGEQYSSWISPAFTSLQTLDTTGSLRLQREGNTATASYLAGSTWMPIASGPTRLDPATINLETTSFMNRFAHQEVKIAWDNLRINSGTISCPTTSWEDDSPDWQPAPP